MISNIFSSGTIGWFAVATGISGLFAFIFIVLFFTVGQPYGTINDYFIGLTAIMSGILAWMLYSWHHTQAPLLSQFALGLALVGAAIVVIGVVLTLSGRTGFYMSGQLMAVGNALIGLWLIAISYSALSADIFPRALVIFGLISGVILALGLAAVPGIFQGLDTKSYAITATNAIWGTGTLGYFLLLPIWSILAGKIVLLK